MSSTNRGHQRIELDHYATPTYAVHRLLDALMATHTFGRYGGSPLFRMASTAHGPRPHWLEPCAGNGAVVRAVNTWCSGTSWQPLRESGSRETPRPPLWTMAEIREDARDPLNNLNDGHHISIGDFLATPIVPLAFPHEDFEPGDKPWQVCLTNPPFFLAMEFIRACMSLAEHTIMLLRLNFLGSEERSNFIRETTPDLYVLPDRPEFVMSISCGEGRGARDEALDPILPGAPELGGLVRRPCGYKSTLPFTVPRPKTCPGCGGRVKITTSDSVSYAWFHWHDRASGKYTMLASTPVAERKADQAK